MAASTIPGAGLAWLCVFLGVFVTAFYSFRLYFLTFHGPERMDHPTREHLHETPAVVTVPLILLAIPSIVIGYVTVGPVVFGDFFHGVLYVAPAHDVLHHLAGEFHGPAAFAAHGLLGPPFGLVVAGFAAAWYIYLRRPERADQLRLLTVEKKRATMANKEEKREEACMNMPPSGWSSERELIVGLKAI